MRSGQRRRLDGKKTDKMEPHADRMEGEGENILTRERQLMFNGYIE